MSESVTVESGGLTVTTNTASEADLRAELARDAPPAEGTPETPPAGDAPPAKERDEKGRFLKREAAAAPAAEPDDAAAPPDDETVPGKPGRDLSLPRNGLQARINKALEQKRAAEERAAFFEAELRRARQGVTSPVTPQSPAPPQTAPQAAPPAGVEPDFARDFAGNPAYADDPYTHYLQAWARWDNQRQVEARFAAWEAQQTAKVQQTAFEARIREGAQAHPDWSEALTQADTLGLQVSAVMQAAIMASPRAADLVHDLATHPEICTQLAEESVQTPVAAAPVMRRLLESRLSAPAVAPNGHGSAAPPTISTAQPPVKPVGSSPVGSDAPPGDEASAAEHARYWNRKLKVPGTPR